MTFLNYKAKRNGARSFASSDCLSMCSYFQNKDLPTLPSPPMDPGDFTGLKESAKPYRLQFLLPTKAASET